MKNSYTLFVITLMYGAYALAGGEFSQGVPWQELEKKQLVRTEYPPAGGIWQAKFFQDGSRLQRVRGPGTETIYYLYTDPAGNKTYYRVAEKHLGEIIKYEPVRQIAQTVLSLQEQSARKVSAVIQESIEAILEEIEATLEGRKFEISTEADCNVFETILESVELSPIIQKEFEKNIVLCKLLDAFKGLAKNERDKFSVAEQIINTKIGRTNKDIVDPDTAVKGQSLLTLLLKIATKTEDNDNFRELLHLVQMLLNKGALIGFKEESLLFGRRSKVLEKELGPKAIPANTVIGNLLDIRQHDFRLLKKDDNIKLLLEALIN
jgi:hypothetical protein